MTDPPVPAVLGVDADRDIAELVEAVLSDAGYAVSLLYQLEGDVVAAAVGQLEPDCLLPDSGGPADDGPSWALAERLAVRGRAVPVVLFSTRLENLREATAHESERSRAAHFAGVLGKPFDLEELLDVVARATGASVPFDRSRQADAARTQALVERVRAGGASDIRRATLGSRSRLGMAMTRRPSSAKSWARSASERGLCRRRIP